MPKNLMQFTTLAFQAKVPAAGDPVAVAAPQPTSEGERYLLALLESKRALNVALDALIARAAIASGEESVYIEIQKGNIKADYLKLDAVLKAYLSSRTVFKPFSDEDVVKIRGILDRIQAFRAEKEKASEILAAVTELLNEWSHDNAQG